MHYQAQLVTANITADRLAATNIIVYSELCVPATPAMQPAGEVDGGQQDFSKKRAG